MKRSHRSFSMVELSIVVGLTIGMLLMMQESLHLAARWRATVYEVERATTDGDRLRQKLREATHEGVPVDALAITSDGELVESEGDDQAAHRWKAGEALILRAHDAYWIFECKGDQLVRRRIGFDGQITLRPVLPARRARFTPRRDANGRLQGIDYEVEFKGGTQSGFVGCRTQIEQGGPPEFPGTAPRWKPGGSR